MSEELESLKAIAHTDGSPRELGNLTRAAEEARGVWTWVWLEQLWGDIRYAWRNMCQNPGFSATALLSLALGIGANTAIFSLIDAILLRTLPISHPEGLVVLASFSRDERVGDFGYPDYLRVRNGNHTFSGVLATSSLVRTEVGLGTETAVANRKIVSSNYFSVLGVEPALGRVFRKDDENLQVAIISQRFWKRNFEGSPSAIGKQIDLDGLPFTIVGVAPLEFFGETVGEAPDIWATISLMPERMNMPGFTWLSLIGRLKPGIQEQQARADLSRLVPQLDDSESRGGFIRRIAVESAERGGSGLRASLSAPLTILMAVVTVVLLIACANLASLLLARAARRQREIATRLALGAGRGRIVRQLLTESLTLALLGGVLGLVFAVCAEQFLLRLVSEVGHSITVDLRPDIYILGFTAIISVVTGVLFGLAPALRAVRQGAGSTLAINSRGVALSDGRSRLKDGLIAVQVALSLLLLVVGGLFIRTIQNLKTQDVGFHGANVLSAQIVAERDYRPSWPQVIVSLLQRLDAIPGVQSASVSFNGTLADSTSGVNGLKFDGYPARNENQRAEANWIGPDYFKTSGITLLQGRTFSLTDNAGSQKVAILNQTMSRQYFGTQSAVGKGFEFNKEHYTIVGVARDAKYVDLRESNVPFVYFAALQSNAEIHSLEVRTRNQPLAFAGALRDVVRQTDPHLRIGEITTLEKRINQKLAREFLIADIAGFFSGLTLLLVCIGIYGTLAYTVARRTNEIGIRMALGARAASVVGNILRDLLRVVVPGLIAGVASAVAVERLVGSMLFGLKPTDLLTIGLATLVLTAATLVAAYIPARRASRVDPVTALRFE